MKKAVVQSEIFSRKEIQDAIEGVKASYTSLADELPDNPAVAIHKKGFLASLGALAKIIGQPRG